MEAISHIDWVIYGAAVFITAIFSGIAGAGGGFIMTPLLIFLGATSAQAVSTGKFSGLAVSIGSLSGLRKVKIHSKRTVLVIVAMALIAGLLAPFVIVNLDNEVYKTLLGILLLVMIPVLYIKKVGQRMTKPGSKKRFLGYALVGLSLWLQGVFSGGVGTFVNVALMGFLGMTALEANVVKRYSQLILNSVILLAVFYTGLVIWPIAIIGSVMALIGGYIGGKLAFKSGDIFVMNIFMIFMLISGVALIIG